MSEPVAAETPGPSRRRMWIGIGITLGVLFLAVLAAWWTMIRMPGTSFAGELPPLSDQQTGLQAELERHVNVLASDIGERHLQAYPELMRAADYIEKEFETYGYTVTRQEYEISHTPVFNLEVEITGSKRPDEILVVGAHYDTVAMTGTPGANDNASGVAGVLALAKRFAGSQPERTLRFVAFTNEEPPFFQTPQMGSRVYARQCREQKENIVAALSLETIGYYDAEAGSQQYPPVFGSFYPAEGNFIAVVGNVASRDLVRQVVASFRQHGRFPSEGGALPDVIQGVGWSDHWSFWQEGYPAVMITDTAPYRYPYYHLPEDTPDKLNFAHMARVVEGVHGVIAEMAGVEAEE